VTTFWAARKCRGGRRLFDRRERDEPLRSFSIPGLAYTGNMHFPPARVRLLHRQVAVSVVFIPAYYKGDSRPHTIFSESVLAHPAEITSRLSSSQEFWLRRPVSRHGHPCAPHHRPGLFDQHPAHRCLHACLHVLGGLKAVVAMDVVQALYLSERRRCRDGNHHPPASERLGRCRQLCHGERSRQIRHDQPLVRRWILGLSRKRRTRCRRILGGTFLNMASHGTDHFSCSASSAANRAGTVSGPSCSTPPLLFCSSRSS